jgi:hypothetical protein
MGHIVVCEAAFNWGGETVCPYLCSHFSPHEQRRASTLLGYWHGSQRESRLSHEASEYIAIEAEALGQDCDCHVLATEAPNISSCSSAVSPELTCLPSIRSKRWKFSSTYCLGPRRSAFQDSGRGVRSMAGTAAVMLGARAASFRDRFTRSRA